MPGDHIVVRQQEPPGRGVGIGRDVRFEVAELTGIGVDIGVEPDEGRPVPARTGREHGVFDGGGFIVAAGARTAQRRNSWTTGTLGVCLMT